MFMVLSEIDPTQTGLAVVVTGIVYALIDKIIVPLIKKDKSHDGSSISTECKGKWSTQTVYNESIRRDLAAFRDDINKRLDKLDQRVSRNSDRGDGIREELSKFGTQVAVAKEIVSRIEATLR